MVVDAVLVIVVPLEVVVEDDWLVGVVGSGVCLW